MKKVEKRVVQICSYKVHSYKDGRYLMHLRLADEGTSAILEIAMKTLQDFQIPATTEGYWLDKNTSEGAVNGGREFVCTDPLLIKYTTKKSRT